MNEQSLVGYYTVMILFYAYSDFLDDGKATVMLTIKPSPAKNMTGLFKIWSGKDRAYGHPPQGLKDTCWVNTLFRPEALPKPILDPKM